MRILGIDPGTQITGYGILEKRNNHIIHIDNGGIFPPKKAPFYKKISHIHEKISEIIQKYAPDMVALEDIFVAKNAMSSLKLGHARGAIMVATHQFQLPLYEYTPTQVKQALTGYGRATKEQIQKMVQALLKLPETAFTDASDALAIAICHLHSYRMKKIQ